MLMDSIAEDSEEDSNVDSDEQIGLQEQSDSHGNDVQEQGGDTDVYNDYSDGELDVIDSDNESSSEEESNLSYVWRAFQ